MHGPPITIPSGKMLHSLVRPLSPSKQATELTSAWQPISAAMQFTVIVKEWVCY